MTKYRDEPILTSDTKLIHWLGLDHFKPEQALTSHFVSTKTLFFIRLLWTTYMTAVIWIDIIYTLLTGEFRHFLVYFTDLTSIGLYAYLMTTCIHHAKYLQSKRPDSFLNQAAVLNYLYMYLYHTIITYNILTPVVFWTLLAKERLFEAHLPVIECWISISLHAVTMMMMVMEIMLSRMVIQIRMILLVFGTVLLYLGMVFIVFAIETWWVYSFLDWTKGSSVAIWYIAIAVFVVICFFVQVGIHACRDGLVQWKTKQVIKESPVYPCSGFEPLSSSIVASHISE